MSSFVDLLPRALTGKTVEAQNGEATERSSLAAVKQRLETFEDEQLRSLVRQIFLSPSASACAQVVFSPVDPGVDTGLLSRRIGETLSRCVTGTVCVVEGLLTDTAAAGHAIHLASSQKSFGMLRHSAEQLSANLWVLGTDVLTQGDERLPSEVLLRGRLAELRLEFDYMILQGSSCLGSEGSLLGSLCDGLVLIVQANNTRRATAQKAKQALDAASVRLLGVVLSERTFPIPEGIYKRV